MRSSIELTVAILAQFCLVGYPGMTMSCTALPAWCRRRPRGLGRWFILLVAAMVSLTLNASAQETTTPPPAAVRELLQLLEDPAVQEWLRAHQTAAAQADIPEAPAPQRTPSHCLDERLVAVRQHVLDLRAALPTYMGDPADDEHEQVTEDNLTQQRRTVAEEEQADAAGGEGQGMRRSHRSGAAKPRNRESVIRAADRGCPMRRSLPSIGLLESTCGQFPGRRRCEG